VGQLPERMMPSSYPCDDIGNFSGELTGRAGHILYREPQREITIYWESMVQKNQDGSKVFGVSVTCDFQYWSNPKGDPIAEGCQLVLLRALRDWLHDQGIRSSIDLPSDLSEAPENCLWKHCHRNRLKNIYYCEQHFDMASLVSIR
jgi:hypothetical protein